MDTQLLKTRFKANFPLPAHGFSQTTDFVDIPLGFAVFKDRDETGYKSLFKLMISQEQLNSQGSRKNIEVSVSYGKETNDGLITASKHIKKGIGSPIDLESNDYFYDIEENKIYFKSQVITGLDLLSNLDLLHTKPTKPVRGFWIRLRLVWYHVFLANFFKSLFTATAGIQYLISGDRIHIFHDLRESRSEYNSQFIKNITSSKAEPIEMVGLRVNPWIAFVYSLFHLGVYFLCYYFNFRPRWLITIFENNFLTIIYVVVTLVFANAILPEIMSTNKALRYPLVYLQTRYIKSLGKKLRI